MECCDAHPSHCNCSGFVQARRCFTLIVVALPPPSHSHSHLHQAQPHLLAPLLPALSTELARVESEALEFLANTYGGGKAAAAAGVSTGDDDARHLDALLSGDEAVLRALDAGDTDRVNSLLAVRACVREGVKE